MSKKKKKPDVVKLHVMSLHASVTLTTPKSVHVPTPVSMGMRLAAWNLKVEVNNWRGV